MLAYSLVEHFEYRGTMEDGNFEVDVYETKKREEFDIDKWIDDTAHELELLRAGRG